MTPDINPLRSVVAVLGGLLLWNVLDQVLETTLVRAVAGAPLNNLTEYLAVRNQAGLLAAKLVYDSFAAILAGYMCAKIATEAEMKHAAACAAALTATLAYGYTVGETAALTPIWARVGVLLVVAPALMLGAWVRAQAAQLQGGVPPEPPPEPEQEDTW